MSATEEREVVAEGLTVPLDEAELDELQEILVARAEGDGLLLDAVHGLVTALVVGPEAVEAEEWMPHVLDEHSSFDSPADAEHAIRLLLRLHNTIVADLESLSYQPILAQVDAEDGTLSAQGWCEGFSLGVDLRAEHWEARMREDPRLFALMDPVVALAADDGLFGRERGGAMTPLSELEYDAALAALPNAIVELQQYWKDYPLGAEIPEDAKHQVPRMRAGRGLH